MYVQQKQVEKQELLCDRLLWLLLWLLQLWCFFCSSVVAAVVAAVAAVAIAAVVAAVVVATVVQSQDQPVTAVADAAVHEQQQYVAEKGRVGATVCMGRAPLAYLKN